MAKIIGLGGIFFRCADPAATRAWYAEHLGIAADQYGAVFSEAAVMTVWNPFDATTDYFGSPDQPFMINFRVDDLDALMADLAAKGIAPVAPGMSESYGKFAWITDCDGRRIELWEPIGAL
jgi:predicted enzyme related to lactoylglutathione lyase